MINIWCKTLRPLELAAFWIKNFFVPLTVHYDEYVIAPSARKLLAWAQDMGCCRNFVPAALDFHARDEQGLGLCYRANRDLAACCNDFLKQHAPNADERYRQMTKTFIRVHLEQQFLFITYALARAAETGMQNNRIVIEPGALNSTLAAFYRERGLAVSSMLNIGQVCRAWLAPLVFSGIQLAARLLPRDLRSNIGTVRPAVWIEYNDGDRNALGFWIKYTDPRDFDIVYYLDRSDSPLTEWRTAKLEKRGLKWIDAHRIELFWLGRVPLRRLAAMLASWLSLREGGPFWFRGFKFQEKLWYQLYRSAFEKFQVKLLIQHQDRGWQQAVQAHAVEDAGGIMVGYHWSNLPYTMDNWFLNSQHVYFVWGEAMHDSMQKKGHTSRHILPSGIWLKKTSEEKPAKLAELDPALEFVMSIFDSDIDHGFLMPVTQTPELLADFLLCVLDLLETHPRWGAILKFKNATLDGYQWRLPHGADIVKRMRALMAQRRLVELDLDVSAITASEYSNLSVCYVLNSAGIVSGIFGNAAVHWDCVGQDHPLYQDPDQKVVFKSLPQLASAVEDAAAGDKSIGDLSEWRGDYNYFLDFEADKRIAGFIQHYMNESVAGADPEQTLAAAVHSYHEENKLPRPPFGRVA